jgi:hypothetical protein
MAILETGRRGVNEGGKSVDAGKGHIHRLPPSSDTCPRWFARGRILSPFYAAFRPLFWRVGSLACIYTFEPPFTASGKMRP